MSRPRIVFNALALRSEGGGVQTYIRELLRALVADSGLELAARVQADAVDALPAEVSHLVTSVSSGVRRALDGFRSLGPADLIHGLDIDLPARPSAPTVITVHDVSVFDVPWAFPRLRARGEQMLVRRSIRTADAIISVSAFTADRVQDLFGRDSVVTHLAPSPGFVPQSRSVIEEVRARHVLPETFVLQVGTIEPRKGVDRTAAACRDLGVPLVLTGTLVPGTELPSDAVHLGYVPTVDLPALYGAAAVVTYPSAYEGFGLPPIEAMASGAAVVATAVGALPEVAARGALLIPPGDPDAFASALGELLGDECRRQSLAAAGREAASALTWRSTAEGTVDVYRSLGVG